MSAIRLPNPTGSRELIETAIETHGAIRVLLAALRALLRPKARPPDRRPVRHDRLELPDHLRRDIGLEPYAYAAHWSRYLN